MKRIILVLMENVLGVLLRIVGVFLQCGYNVDLLCVVLIEDLSLLCLIIIIYGDDKVIE